MSQLSYRIGRSVRVDPVICPGCFEPFVPTFGLAALVDATDGADGVLCDGCADAADPGLFARLVDARASDER